MVLFLWTTPGPLDVYERRCRVRIGARELREDLMFWKKAEPLLSKKVIEKELEYLKISEKSKDIWGLGISGGGIRSASFGLGVLQALVGGANKSILSKMDYLSTVSGGGYIGSALTWFLEKGLPEGGDAGTEPDNFPLGQVGSGARSDPKGNLVLDFIRQHGNYLMPGRGLNLLSLFGVTVRSMFISLVVYLAILTSIICGLKYAQFFSKFPLNVFGFQFIPIPLVLWLAMGIVVLLIIMSLIFSIRTRFKVASLQRYKNQIRGQKFLGVAWTIIYVALVLGSMVYVSQYLKPFWKHLLAGSSISFGSVMGLLQHKREVNPGGKKTSGLPTPLIVLSALAIIYGLLLAAFLLSGYFTQSVHFIVLIAVTVILGCVVDLNYVGLHRMYRDRMMETFLPNKDIVKDNRWRPATEANDALLKNMCTKSKRPYHLINTNIVLVDSPTAKFRGRGGDSFLLSKLFSGSDATGYIPTTDIMKKGGRGMTLPTAIAISGAAVNPHTGAAGKGPTMNKAVSALLGILNLRLGFWAKNPKKNHIPAPPTFIHPGLKGDVLGGDLTENDYFIQLTDGGHFENLALYELIRRRAKVIIISDAGADKNYNFGSLANAIEKVRVDFGVKIRFKNDLDIDGLIPGSSEKDDAFSNRYELAARGFAVAEIHYPDNGPSDATLIYLKSTLIPDLPADIYGYRSANSDFPNQTTANQFYTEEQIEAYRELGYQLTKKMLQDDTCKEILGI